MNISKKVLLLIIIPMLAAIALINLLVNLRTYDISQKQAAAYKTVLMEVRRIELINYTKTARSVFEGLYELSDFDQYIAKNIMHEIQNNLAFLENTLFYPYSPDHMIACPVRKVLLLDKNEDKQLAYQEEVIIQEMFCEKMNNRDLATFLWRKTPLSGIGKKLLLSNILHTWQWPFGVSRYVINLEHRVAAIKSIMNKQIEELSFVFRWTASLSLLLLFFSALLLQLSERKAAERKLRELTTQVLNIQDEERHRISRELHDSISQALVATKFSLESAFKHLKDKHIQGARLLQDSSNQLDETLREIRRISRNLHPSVLDDLGLMAAMDSLSKEFQKRSNIQVNLYANIAEKKLSRSANTALYRIAQESLSNIERHSSAKEVTIDVVMQKKWLKLTISDDGKGFDVSTIQNNRYPDMGSGLRNMTERIHYFKGKLRIQSSDKGTTIIAAVPIKFILYENNGKQVPA